jgi:hypothetical protein
MTNVSIPTNQLTSETINTLLLNKSFELVHTLNSNEPPVIRITDMEDVIEIYIDSENLRCDAKTTGASTARSLELLGQSDALRNLFNKYLRGAHTAYQWGLLCEVAECEDELEFLERDERIARGEECVEECDDSYQQEYEDYQNAHNHFLLELEEERHYKSDYYRSSYTPSEKELALAEAFNADIELLEATSRNKHQYNPNLSQVEKDTLKFLAEMSWEEEKAREDENPYSSLSDDEYLPF